MQQGASELSCQRLSLHMALSLFCWPLLGSSTMTAEGDHCHSWSDVQTNLAHSSQPGGTNVLRKSPSDLQRTWMPHFASFSSMGVESREKFISNYFFGLILDLCLKMTKSLKMAKSISSFSFSNVPSWISYRGFKAL